MPMGKKKVRQLIAGDLIKLGSSWREVISCARNGDGTYSLGVEGAPPVDWGSEMEFDVREKPVDSDLLGKLFGGGAFGKGPRGYPYA